MPQQSPQGAAGPEAASAGPALEPIAIIGIGCRFPGGVDSPEAMWRLVREGVDAVGEIPADRPELRALYDATPGTPGKIASRRGGFVSNLDQFDPDFFGISPREAVSIDPQQRLLLETAWEAFEDAGTPPGDLAGRKVGVFVGMWTNDYEDRMFEATSNIDLYMTTGGGRYSASGRLSYAFDLHGPSMTVDTACSSSLVTVHLACQSLRSGESTLALAGGVNLILKPWISIGYSRSKMLSPDGRCKFGDAGANGYVRSEGVGVVLLKRLSEALADGDPIYALVRGSAVNNDGQSSGLLVAPGADAQERMLRDAYRSAGVDPRALRYVEAHGTGTGVGDPVELTALGAVLGEGRPADRPCRVGSIKTNIGHTEAASGVAGLIKVALALKHGEIPPSLHCTNPNPKIPWQALGMEIQQGLTPWPAGEGPRYSGVNSFGVTGTNAHVVLEEAPATRVAATREAAVANLLCLSARTEAARVELAVRYERRLAESPQEWPAVCAAAALGRTHFPVRVAVAAADADDAREKLSAFAAGRILAGVARGQAAEGPPGIAFLFTGQGAQYVGMGARLYDAEPVFRQALERCDEILRPEREHRLLGVLFPERFPGAPAGLLDRTAYTQPALFALEYALSELWRSWGVVPSHVLGHSVGEYVAACVAGVFSLEDGLRLIATRGRLMEALPPGGKMAAVFADEARVAGAIAAYAREVSMAALNGPENAVISGAASAVDAVLAQLSTEGVKSKALVVSHAFHSPLMEPMLAEFEDAAARVRFHPPTVPLVSNLTGQVFAEGRTPDARYWRDHVRAAVRFADGIRGLYDQGCRQFLEVGPSPTLSGMALRCVPEANGASWLPSLRKDREDVVQMLGTLGALYAAGLAPAWQGVFRERSRDRVSLPRYPFQRERFWIDESGLPAGNQVETPSAGADATDAHPVLGRRLRSALKTIVYETQMVSRRPLLDHHRFYGAAVFPAAGYLEMALEAARDTFTGAVAVRNLTIEQPLVVPDGEAPTVQVVVQPTGSGASFEVHSAESDDDEWTRHVTATLEPGAPLEGDFDPLQTARGRCTENISGGPFYDSRLARGASVGPSLQAIDQIWRRDGEALAQLALSEEERNQATRYHVHPALLDAALQLVLSALPGGGRDEVYLPVGVGCLTLPAGSTSTVAFCHAQLTGNLEADRETYRANVRLLDASGRPVAALEDVLVKRASTTVLRQLAERASFGDWLYGVEWRPQPLAGEGRVFGREQTLLVLADRGGVGRALAARFEQEGTRTLVVHAGAADADASHRSLDPGDPEAFPALLAEAGPLAGVVHLWSLDTPDPVFGESLEPSQRLACGSLLRLVQALSAGSATPGVLPMAIVTRGAQALGDVASLAIAQAPILGLARVLALEQPELRVRRVDLDPAASAEPAAEVVAKELRADDGEDETAWRDGVRYAARLVRAAAAPEGRLRLPKNLPFVLRKPADGVLDHLHGEAVARRTPGAGEVEIEVRAAGLNFRDVLNALGMYPGEAGPLGLECAGCVTAVGEGVSGVAVGDEVVAMAFGSFSSHVLTPAELVVGKPKGLSFAEAATIPVTFLTAWYGLHECAAIKAGDRVLIHAAAGGVGLSALQIARAAGAEIYATAGSPEKHAHLRALGVRHVFSSRTLEFADQIRAATGGAGVDIVLNSLAGEFLEKSVEILAPRGRFLEIGKRGIWTPERMAQVKPQASYSIIALDQMAKDTPVLVGRLFRALMQRFAEGGLVPLPYRPFDFAQAPVAFRYMAQAKNIGKVVLTREASETATARRSSLRPEATYLITGGLGGLGLRVAEELAERGARNLVLMGRREPGEAARAAIAGLTDRGARVHVARGDVARTEDVARVRAEVRAAALPPLRGIVHAAGILSDGVLLQQDWTRFADVMAPKIDGAWNLMGWAREESPDFLVFFSSVAALLGSKGQGNYAAANAFLDALAHQQSARGRNTVSIDWGPWSEVGMAAGLGERDMLRWTRQGIRAIAPAAGLTILMRLLESGSAQVGVVPIKWTTFAGQFGGRLPPFLSGFSEVGRAPGAPVETPVAAGFAQALEKAPKDKQAEMVLAHVREQAARTLGLPPSKRLDAGRPLKELGLDSLMSVELRNALVNSLERALPGTLIFDYPTIGAIADFVSGEMFGRTEARPTPSHEENQDAQAKNAVQQLSEEEAEALLAEKLAALEDKDLE